VWVAISSACTGFVSTLFKKRCPEGLLLSLWGHKNRRWGGRIAGALLLEFDPRWGHGSACGQLDRARKLAEHTGPFKSPGE